MKWMLINMKKCLFDTQKWNLIGGINNYCNQFFVAKSRNMNAFGDLYS